MYFCIVLNTIMQAIDNIKIKAGKVLLRKEVKKNIRKNIKVCNLNEAKSVALLMNITDELDVKKVTKFEKFLKGEFGIKNVFALGYFDGKEIPSFLRSSIGFDYISRKDLSWNGVPSGNTYTNFISEKYDILIDFTNYYNVPLRFTLLRSSAQFKIGRYSELNTSYYDLMIDFEKDDFEEFANQIVHYLSIINATK